MLIQVTVKPNAKKESVEELTDGSYRVAVHAAPSKGRANDAVVKLLARHFSVAKSRITVVRGHKGRRKQIKVEI